MKHYDECYFVNYDSYEDLCLYEIGSQKCPSKYSFGPIIRENYVLHYVLEGSGTLYLNDESFPVTGGQAFIIPPKLAAYYTADEQTPWNYIWIHFNGNRAFDLLNAANITAQNPVFISDTAKETLNTCMMRLLQEHEKELLCISQLYLLFHYMIENAPKQPEPEHPEAHLKYIKDTINYINKKFNDPIKVADIAEFCGLDRSYLSKIFKQATGYSPQEYLIYYRIRKAKQYLKDPSFSIQHVAYAVGYPDPFAFSKIFKKATGISPSEYRSKHLTIV